jgi:hypothetical protein
MLTGRCAGGAIASFGFGAVEQPASSAAAAAIVHFAEIRIPRPRFLSIAVDQQNSRVRVNVPVNGKLLLTCDYWPRSCR